MNIFNHYPHQHYYGHDQHHLCRSKVAGWPQTNPQILLLLSPDCIEYRFLLSPIGDVPTYTPPENLS